MSAPARNLDIFPAVVIITASNAYPDTDPSTVGINAGYAPAGSTAAPKARVIASNGFIIIGVDGPNGPITYFKEEYIQLTKDDSKIYRFITKSNRIIVVQKDRACGCGSRLKNWFPGGSMSISEGS